MITAIFYNFFLGRKFICSKWLSRVSKLLGGYSLIFKLNILSVNSIPEGLLGIIQLKFYLDRIESFLTSKHTQIGLNRGVLFAQKWKLLHDSIPLAKEPPPFITSLNLHHTTHRIPAPHYTMREKDGEIHHYLHRRSHHVKISLIIRR